MTSQFKPSGALVRYSLPFPPSVNSLFFNKEEGGRGKVAAYRKWRKSAGEEILVQGRRSLKGPVSLCILAVKPDKRRRDISNLVKAVEDLLVSMQIIEDDSLVQRLSIEWADDTGFECLVLVQPHEEALAA